MYNLNYNICIKCIGLITRRSCRCHTVYGYIIYNYYNNNSIYVYIYIYIYMCLADFPLKLLVCPTAPSPKKRERHVKPREPRTPRGQSNFIRRWWLNHSRFCKLFAYDVAWRGVPRLKKPSELNWNLNSHTHVHEMDGAITEDYVGVRWVSG